MPLSRRYTPSHHPGDLVSIGLDFSTVLPVGVGIQEPGVDAQDPPDGTPRLEILANFNPPADASADWTIGDVLVSGRAVYTVIAGGQDGVDYLLRWTITDTLGNVWTRTALMQCAVTS